MSDTITEIQIKSDGKVEENEAMTVCKITK